MSDAGVNDQAMPSGEPLNPPVTAISPGAQLATYREERGWTIEQVASQLNLAPRQIAAIESDDFAALPGMPIVRGFIRQYAKLLKVDPAPLVATLIREPAPADASITPRKNLATPFSEARLPSMTDRSGVQFKWIVALLLAILIGAAIWAWYQGSEVAGLSKAATAQVKDGLTQMANSASATLQLDSQKSNETKGEASIGVSSQGAEATPESVQPAASANGAPTVATPSPAVAPTAEVPPAPTQVASPSSTSQDSGKDALVLKALKDSWIEVKRTSNNSTLVSRLLKAGETETVNITEPVSVVIGNVSGVEASLRGEPVMLKTGGNGNVARLTLK